jgi:Uma2 family endonuclease
VGNGDPSAPSAISIINQRDSGVAFVVTERRPLGYADYLNLPMDGKKCEIIRGELWVTPSPTIRHQVVVRNMYDILREQVMPMKLGEVLFASTCVRLLPDEVVEPDLLFVRADRVPIIDDRAVNAPPIC